jgi:cytosine/adenosine deaminase-related metal-dependent hydrolase
MSEVYFFELIIPLNGQEILPKGFIEVENNLIKNMGRQADLVLQPGQSLEINTNCIAIPKFINAHTHLAYPAMQLPGKSIDWIEQIIQESRGYESNHKSKIARQNLKASQQAGTEFLVENTPFKQTVQEIASCGQNSLIAWEVFGQTADLFSAYLKTLNELQVDFPNLEFIFSPHSIYNVSADLLQAVQDWALKNQKLTCLHLAEFDFESALIKTGKPSGALNNFYQKHKMPPPNLLGLYGLSPVEYLQKLNCLQENLLLTHCLHVNTKDINLLAKAQAKIISCPRSNAYLQNGLMLLPEMLEHDLQICFGTDSLASNFDLNLVEEIKFAYLAYRQAGHRIPARFFWEAITSVPAKILGLNLLGSLEIGKKALFNSWQLNEAQMQKALNLKENIYEFLWTL